MSVLRNKDTFQVLTTWAIEKTLLGNGKQTYDRVVVLLKDEYRCTLADCYEHPEYLKAVLGRVADYDRLAIVVSITNELKEFLYKEPIRKFVEGIIPSSDG